LTHATVDMHRLDVIICHILTLERYQGKRQGCKFSTTEQLGSHFDHFTTIHFEKARS